MFRILDRYIFREIAQSWLAVTLVLLAILLTNQFARVLGDVAKDKLPKDAIFQIIGLTGLQYLTILVPIGLFLAVMLALGRLYRDSEMPAMMACRVGPGDVYRPLAFLLVPLAAAVAWLSLEIAPMALTEIERIGAEARRQADLASIEPGRFISDSRSNGARSFMRRTSSNSGTIEKVFLQRHDRRWCRSCYCRSAANRFESDDPNRRFFVLHDGTAIRGRPWHGATSGSVEFAEHGIPYRAARCRSSRSWNPGRCARQISCSSPPQHWSSLNCIGALVFRSRRWYLQMLAVPLSRSQPRQGRYGRLGDRSAGFYHLFQPAERR